MTVSRHYYIDRQDREALIQEIGYGEVIKSVVVDHGHRNGLEIHEISNTGIITIFNKDTHKLITKLIATTSQIKRYYDNRNEIPRELLDKAFRHQQLGYQYR